MYKELVGRDRASFKLLLVSVCHAKFFPRLDMGAKKMEVLVPVL